MPRRVPRKPRPKKTNVPKGYDSLWEYDIHQTLLKDWKHHWDNIDYIVKHKYEPDFVKVIWEGNLELPPDRPAGQQIDVTYEYDDNQIMKCSFLDVASNKKTNIDLSMTDKNEISESDSDIDQFLVE